MTLVDSIKVWYPVLGNEYGRTLPSLNAIIHCVDRSYWRNMTLPEMVMWVLTISFVMSQNTRRRCACHSSLLTTSVMVSCRPLRFLLVSFQHVNFLSVLKHHRVQKVQFSVRADWLRPQCQVSSCPCSALTIHGFSDLRSMVLPIFLQSKNGQS